MELWQLDTVGGFLLADGSTAKALTGIDDHSRFCVSARLMPRERTQSVCDGFTSALRTYGVPAQVLTDTGSLLREAKPWFLGSPGWSFVDGGHDLPEKRASAPVL